MVSIIIPHNNEDTLAKCIESIKKSSYKDVEIIEVCEGKERSEQRNIGAKRAKGEYLLFLDADMYIHSELIADCLDLCEDFPGRDAEGFVEYEGCYDALYIPEVVVGKGFWIKVRNFERSFYNGTCIDAIRFMRKDKFPGFDENLTGVEDWDMDRRFKGDKGMASFPIYHVEGEFNLWKYQRKKAYYTKWMDRYKRLYPKCKELNFWYRYFGVFWEGGKWKKCLKAPILYLSTLFLRLLVGVIYLCRDV